MMRNMLLGATLLVLFLAFSPSFALAEGGGDVDRKALGEEVCKGLGPYCQSAWNLELGRGASFNNLIHWICTLVWNREGDHVAIDCVENGIRTAGRMTPAALIHGQFKPGEREDNTHWRAGSDKEWADLTKSMIKKIPPYCDQHTPVIFNYFTCISYEVLNLTRRLKKPT